MLAERIVETDTAEEDVILRLAGISKYFSIVPALRDVNIAFHRGEVHAILGENGAGKSTLMNIIAGVFHPSEGEVTIEGRTLAGLTPELAKAHGIGICFQHPAILKDLSVFENMRVSLPDQVFMGRQARDVVKEALDIVGLQVPLGLRADTLTVAQKHLLEIAKALVLKPRILILDEPTASLDQDSTDMLFARIREIVAKGTTVIYITHRLAEIRQIAHRVTILRDGKVRGVERVANVSDSDLVNMIVGRTLEAAFPPKAERAPDGMALSVAGVSSRDLSGVSFDVPRGQIVGIAGVAGNGQPELMRALAGLSGVDGSITLRGRQLSQGELLKEAAFMPSDRHIEGVASGLTVRENATYSALEKFATAGIMSRKRELAGVTSIFRDLAVKTPGLEAPILSLSGGNQQKVVMARALLSQPGLIIADEPTQGVDVGARFEIYRILREVCDAGTPVVVNSSDAAELEGLCDKVVVLSRGQVVETLEGDDVRESRIVAAAVTSQAHGHGAGTPEVAAPSHGLRRFLQSDNAPAIPLAIVTALLGTYVYSQNANFISVYNVYNILLLATALGFIAMGQTVALLLGGIDLSVGPLAGFLVVVASFFVNDDKSVVMMAAGFGLMTIGALATGAINGFLIRFANFTPIAATLAIYIAIQGGSFLLRENPDGYISSTVTDWLNWQWGPFPVAFLCLVGFAVAGEWALRNTQVGWRLRAVGSDEQAARRIGIRVDRTIIAGYIACSLLTGLGAIMLMAQIGVGDPRQGVNYTLASVTAVVLGGTSLTGGRGTFIGTLLGAVLLTEILNAVTFLGLTQTYQYLFQGSLIIVAALIYTSLRKRNAH
jgi:ribose transport system ATP-binding protein